MNFTLEIASFAAKCGIQSQVSEQKLDEMNWEELNCMHASWERDMEARKQELDRIKEAIDRRQHGT